ncbi:hypothetical protein CBR_g54981 [Chara braunii]|uniref:Uncharacterized protein n=1 Tax=Chara braunii TaxID=69332 RepID=A0A388K7H4_CHABU|nr:hypothetical protein CBR_g54981 [Chara braunii]|eukprot:GBG66002.1 hypothetical protein CBR_g54981 [Chara braunii]
MQEGRPDLNAVAEFPRCVKRIVCHFNSLRATSDGEGARPNGGASGADFLDIEDDDGDDEEEDEAVVKEVAASGNKSKLPKVVGKRRGRIRKVIETEKDSGLQSYFLMSTKARKEKGYRFNLDRTLYDAIHIMQGNNQTVHPPNLVDIGNRQGQQSQQGDHSQLSQAAVDGGEADTSASENKEADAGDGCGSRSSSNGMQGKRKNARQLAFEAVTDMMKTHFTVVAESVDRASKRQFDTATHSRGGSISPINPPGMKTSANFASGCGGWRRCSSMDIQVALRGRVLGRTITFYEMRHRRREEDGRVFDFASAINRREVRHYEVDANGDTILHVSIALGYADNMLHNVVGYATKVGRAIPNRWEGGVDVLADIIDLLMSNIANEHEDLMTDPADFRVHPDPPMHDRPGLRGEIRIIEE